MPVPLAAIGAGLSSGFSFSSALSGLGSALSGVGAVGSIFGSKGRDPVWQARRANKAQFHADRKRALHMPSYQKKGWEKAGIHPIYGMGGSSSQFSPAINVTDGMESSGHTLQRAGAGISRAAEALATTRERLNNRLLETKIEGQEIENAARASAMRMATTGAPPGLVLPVPDREISKRKKDSGKGAGFHPAFREYDLGDGQRFTLPFNEEGPSEAIQSLPFPLNYLKTGEMYYKRHYKKTPGYWLGKKFRKHFR